MTENGHFAKSADEFCDVFNLRLEEIEGTKSILERCEQQAIDIAAK
ncbi:MAG TPA: hypothetical protein VMG30_05955 [Acidobacteriota bacterium]|nr:hypothetical protein [Acidobacteriota bacterium]